jgi:hypothetical protein
VLELIARHGWQSVGEAEWQVLSAAIPGLLPDALQNLPIPTEVPWCGVRQHTLDDLEASLNAFAEVYAARDDLRRFCRAIVIRAKDRAKWASRSDRAAEEKRALKAEMLEWMLVWLGDPALFREWAHLRRSRLTKSA